MRNNPVRRGQLIAPFGVGAMTVVKDGTSLITAGLDHWYKREDGTADEIDITEYQFEEWRLQALLGASHFRLPPDYREVRLGDRVPNARLTVPFLRFPQWHFCPICRLLIELPLSSRGRQLCPECATRNRKNTLLQVPFVAMCDRGHLQDFPWREWVHRSARPNCDRPIRLIATGGSSLAAQRIVCDCDQAERSLSQITSASPDGTETELSNKLDETGEVYLCRGRRPWHGSAQDGTCTRPLRGTLRSASNVYFATVRSAIYLPRGDNARLSNLLELFESPPLSTLASLLRQLNALTPQTLRIQYPALLQPYSDEELKAAIAVIESGVAAPTRPEIESDDQETSFRRAEFDTLRASQDADQLLIRQSPLDTYGDPVPTYFSRAMLVHKLRETRALAGFTRIFAETDQQPEDLRSHLWRDSLQPANDWLPAYIVYGEGIFLELNEARLQVWEQRPQVMKRVTPLLQRYQQVQEVRRLRDRPISPRFILLHTLAHLLINRLTFECGYSSASLRERLYVSNDQRAPMAGILIYTAAGDSEGTMGGLVRMGKPGYLEPVIQRALEDAQWCSADPVCMEIGESGGQGPDSCNLAACHNCGLVPETACEEFNRFLDRGLVIGTIGDRNLGFFSGWGSSSGP